MPLSMFRPVTLGVLLVNAAAGQENGQAAERLEPFFSSISEAGPVPGFAIAVVQGTEVVYLKGFGYADMEAGRPFTPQTVAYIASSTKSFTGLATALLDRQGIFGLDAPLSRYLPHVELAEGLDASRITIRDLLTHIHGIANGGPVVTRTAYTREHTREVSLEVLKAHGPADDGRAFRYGNIGYNVASFAMDAVTGESWKDVERRLIFEPLGMSSTTGYRTQADPNRLAMPYRRLAVAVGPNALCSDAWPSHASGPLCTPARVGPRTTTCVRSDCDGLWLLRRESRQIVRSAAGTPASGGPPLESLTGEPTSTDHTS